MAETTRLQRHTYTVRQAAALLGIGKSSAYRQIEREGQLAGVPVVRVGHRLVIPRAKLHEALGIPDRDDAAA